VSRRSHQSRRRAEALAGLLCLAALFGAGCGGHDGDLAQDTSATRPSYRINFDEEEFATEPELHANPDDIVTLRLENPNGNYADALDTGEEPGVDVIPYRYFETKEREFCWETDPGAESPPNGLPAYMLLLDESQEVVLRVEQDGECVRQIIPAGTYSAEFHHGASVNDDRDLLFIVPRASGDSPTVPTAAALEPGNDAPPAIPPAEPYCPSHALPHYDMLERVLLVRFINDDYGQPCPAPPKKWGYLPFEFFTLPGVCTDV